MTRSAYAALYTLVLAVVVFAALCLAPSVALASGIGDLKLSDVGGPGALVIAGLFGLFGALHVSSKIAAAIRKIKAPDVEIKDHPRLSEAINVADDAALQVLKDTAGDEAFWDDVEAQLKTKSFAEVGGYVLGKYGPKMLEDVKATMQATLQTELSIIFGGSKAVNDSVTLRLGIAAAKIAASDKTVVTLPDGHKVVSLK